MLSAESGRKRMGVYLEDWDSCIQMMADAPFPPATEPITTPPSPLLAGNLVPLPLRPRLNSRKTPPPAFSPPLSPTPTLFVSLQLAEPGKPVSGNLSLHRYRESLSRPRPEVTDPPPARSLKRKPKALNLSTGCVPRTPPSPPPTPSTASVYSGSPSPLPSPALSAKIPVRLNGDDDDSVATPVSTSAAQKSALFAGTFPEPQALGLVSGVNATRPDSQNSKLNAFCKHIRQIPARLFSHNKSFSEVVPSSSHHQRRLHHRGVSFEILNPQRQQYSHSCSSIANIQAKFVDPGNMASPNRSGARSRARSRSVDTERQRTPSRALFDDLETAHSSITSRFPRFNGGANPPQLQPSPAIDLPPDERQDKANDIQQSRPLASFHRRRHSDTAALANMTNSKSHQCTLARHVSTGWSLRAKKGREFPRKPAKLVKRRPGSFAGRNLKHNLLSLSTRNSSSPVLGSYLNRHQPNLNGIRNRIDKPKTIDNIIKNRLNMFDVRLRNARISDLESTESCADIEKHSVEDEEPPTNATQGEHDTETQMHEGSSRCEETANSLQVEASTPLNNPQHVPQELAPPGLYCERNGASSPNFSRPIPPGKWLSSRRFSPFKPLSRSNRIAIDRDGTPCRPCSTVHVQSNQEEEPKNEQTTMKLLSHQSAAVSREIEQGLFQDRSDSQFDGDEPIDLGPGSSQGSSTQHLSQYMGSSAIFPPPLRVSSASSRLSEQGPRNPCLYGGLGTRSSIKRYESSFGGNRTNMRAGLDQRAEQLGSERIHEADDDADRDWETVAGSQQFTRATVNNLAQGDTECSLADCSSFGSLANADEHTGPPLRSSRIGLANSSYNANTVRTPAYAGRYSHYWHQDPSTGQYVLLPNTSYRNSEGARLNAFSKPVPALIASTSRCPTPLPNRYQHPAPLRDAHTNPFCSTPPSLHGPSSQGDEPGNSAGYFPSVGNSKLTSSSNKEDKHTSHRGFGNSQRDSSIRESARASFQHWFSEFVAKDPAQRAVEAASPLHHFNAWNSQNGGLYNSLDASSLNVSKISTISTDDDISTHPLSINLNYHPCFRPFEQPIQPPSHGQLTRENSAVPSRSLSTDRLLPPVPAISKHSPGSLYHSIRSARDRVLGNTHKRKSLNNVLPTTIQESNAHDEPAARPASTGLLERHIQRQGTIKSIFTSRSIHLRTPTIGRRSSTRQGIKQPTADELLRERLEQMDPALLADFCQPSPASRATRATWVPQLPPIDNSLTSAPPRAATIRSPNAVVDEPWTLPANAHFDHLAFPEAPRLEPARRRPAAGNLVEQRRLGRQIIGWCLLAVPLGWIVIAMIGFGAGPTDILIQRRSEGDIDGFHEKEELLARRLSIAIATSMFLAAMIVVAVVVSG
ncbi:predicted protein [Uncinocarpus reesii 1704]|uniref:Uncharacterized protein n=1 Tax=Uncinocarpus reesii (strain UAMH 1704) TaxID=336963 RepID=C4JSE4_UNCRE|nr:uncharacterized protein UREG_05383 [Uncinocarpus reesii 1704]EEP80541.1 predicted protein [Uncinocarpus reesii 1704]